MYVYFVTCPSYHRNICCNDALARNKTFCAYITTSPCGLLPKFPLAGSVDLRFHVSSSDTRFSYGLLVFVIMIQWLLASAKFMQACHVMCLLLLHLTDEVYKL
jgi:hypothetical protein